MSAQLTFRSKLIIAIAALFVATAAFLFVPQPGEAQAGDYMLAVNRQQNVITVYEKDAYGNYTVPFKAMLCATGKNYSSPAGWSTISDQYEWHQLNGGVWGQYCSRYGQASDHVLFHSVYYYQAYNKGSISESRYNMLGTQASDGCINLSVKDAKWIYDNCPPGTLVYVYDSADPGPLGKPTGLKLNAERNWGWDPTDPDPNNPYYSSTWGFVITNEEYLMVEAWGGQLQLNTYDFTNGGMSDFSKMKIWRTSDSSVATVDSNGVVTGWSPGTCWIAVSNLNETYWDTYYIAVGFPVESVSITDLNLVVGEQTYENLTKNPSWCSWLIYAWTSSNSNVASVDSGSGLVKATGEGTARVSVTTDYKRSKNYTSKTASANVNVTQMKVNFLDNDGSAISTQLVNYGDTIKYPTTTPNLQANSQLILAGWDKSYDPDTMVLTCKARLAEPEAETTSGKTPGTTLGTDVDAGADAGIGGIGDGNDDNSKTNGGSDTADTGNVLRDLTNKSYSFAGATRYASSRLEATTTYEKAKHVIIACGEKPYDALAASGLSSFDNAPVIITESSELTWDVYWTLSVLGTTQVTIVGGDAAVSSNTENSIMNVLTANCAVDEEPQIERIGGIDRVETANLIYQSKQGEWGSSAIVASSKSAYDAASAAAYATAESAPIFLTDQSGNIGDSTLELVGDGNFNTVMIAGGTAVVTQQTEDSLISICADVTRQSGETRYGTSVAVAQWSIDNSSKLSWDVAGFASGQNFPDVLVGATSAGQHGGVMLLVDNTDDGKQFLNVYSPSATQHILIMGGDSAISPSLRKLILGS